MSVGPPRNYENWLIEYLKYTDKSEAPDVFHFWTGVSVIAGALRRRVWIDQRYFQWTPNFYIVFVAPPGIATKSTCVNVGMRLLRQISGIHFGPQSLTWQGLTLALEEAKDHIQLDEETFQPMSCLTIPLSELGTFLKPQDTDLVDLLVDLWDGQQTEWKHKTRTTGEAIIQNPWMNIIGCVTPAWLRENFPTYIIEGGLTSRIVFVYADKKRQFVPYPSEVIDSRAFLSHASLLVGDLMKIAEMQGEFHLTREAIAWGEAWYRKHWGDRPQTVITERFSGYLARKQTHIHKLALIMSAAQRSTMDITHHDLAAAERMVTALEIDLQKIFLTVGIQDIGRETAEVLATIRAHKVITSANLMRIFLNRIGAKQLDEIMDGLLRTAYVRRNLVIATGELCYEAVDEPQDEPGTVVASG